MEGKKRAKDIHVSQKQSEILWRIIFHCVGMNSESWGTIKFSEMTTMQYWHNRHTLESLYTAQDRHFDVDSFLFCSVLLHTVGDLQVGC